jgi:hypothetical protein
MFFDFLEEMCDKYGDCLSIEDKNDRLSGYIGKKLPIYTA